MKSENVFLYLGILFAWICSAVIIFLYFQERSQQQISIDAPRAATKLELVNRLSTPDAIKIAPPKKILTPFLNPNAIFPKVSAKSYLIYDEESSQVITAKSADEKLPMASITKLTTALVARKFLTTSDKLTLSTSCIGLAGNNANFNPNNSYNLSEILKGLLIVSGSDASCAIASKFENINQNLILEMNNFAKDHELKNTNYTNSIGYDNPNHYSTASDILKISKLVLKDELLTKIVQIKSETIQGTLLENTNELLWTDPDIKGIKTGTTPAAGECLVLRVDKNNRKLLIIILGSNQRYLDSKTLIDFTYTNTKWL